MRYFVKKYVRGDSLSVLDVGSRMVNSRRLGNFRNVFAFNNHKYTGLDIIAGENVDIVISDNKFPFKDGEIDVVVSGSAFEHVEFPWELIKEISRVLKTKGLVCIIAPHSGGIHRMPFDTFRYFPDGMTALAKWASLTILKTAIFKDDTYLMAQKL